jgi:hypothetical protein
MPYSMPSPTYKYGVTISNVSNGLHTYAVAVPKHYTYIDPPQCPTSWLCNHSWLPGAQESPKLPRRAAA